MKYVLYTILVAIGILICYIIFEHNSNHPLTPETVEDIFGKKVSCRLNFKKDIGGIDIHGDKFIYYEYDISSSETQAIADSLINYYPLYKKGAFSDIKIIDTSLAIQWRSMPIKNQIDSLIYQSTFNFFEVQELLKKRFKDNIITSSENLYCCLSADPIGNYFFILVKKQGKLLLVEKSG